MSMIDACELCTTARQSGAGPIGSRRLVQGQQHLLFASLFLAALVRSFQPIRYLFLAHPGGYLGRKAR
jgi:hypothetical protein